MSAPIRLTAVLTHPVQYYAPWFRFVANHCPEIDLTVLYAAQPTPEQQGVGFGRAFQWDIPLTEGYRCRVLRLARPGESVHSDRFLGLDVPEIGRALRESRPDVALVPGWHSVTLLRALWACHRAGIPVLYRGDSNLGTQPEGWRGVVWTARTWLLLRLFDGYLAVGRRAEAYLRRFGVDEARIFLAPHAVDNEFFAVAAARHQRPAARAAVRTRFGLAADDFVVVFAGKLEPKKRPLDLVRALARLRPAGRLLVVGGGPLEAECRAESEALGVRVSWAGVVNQSEIGAAYAAADCLALPSDAGETWGLVVNEAMATGLPCVVSDRAGCAPDLIVPGQTGEVFPSGDIESLAAALGRVRDGARAGHDWAAACRARVGEYSFERATAGLLAGCRSVVARRGATRVKPAPRVIACCGGMVTVSGLERMTFEVLGVLCERGAAVHCILNGWENHRIAPLAERIGASWSTGYYGVALSRRTRNPLRWAQMGWDLLRTSAGLLREARRFHPTHVLVPEFTAALRNAPALALLRLGGVRVILRLGNAPDSGPFYTRLWRWAINPVVDRFVCNSAFTRSELLAHRVPARKVSKIYNTVPSRQRSGGEAPARDPRKAIYVGQIIPEKGLDVLLQALGILVGRGHDVRLDVVGRIDGWESPSYAGYRGRLLARAQAPDLAGRVSFLGWQEDIPALLAAAGVHCCPSRPEIREGFGLVTVEAKQAGIPSVVFPTGALPELVRHGVDGWVCAAATAEALAEGIGYFMADPDRLARAGQAARASVDRFSRARFAEAWWAVVQEDGRGAPFGEAPLAPMERMESGASHER